MPLITRSGKTISLVRPKLIYESTVKAKPHKRWSQCLLAREIDLPEVPVKGTIYKCGRIQTTSYSPVLVNLTMRSVAIERKMSIADLYTEALMFYLDDKFSGWDAEVGIDRPTALTKSEELNKRDVTFPGAYNLKHFRTETNRKGQPNRIPGKKLICAYRIPASVHIAIRSIAKTLEMSISDTVTTGVIHYLDENYEGWDDVGDFEEDEEVK